MQINVMVIELPFWEDGRINTVSGGFCRHLNYEDNETESVDGMDLSSGEIRSHIDRIVVCRKCHAWSRTDEESWHDETILENEEPIKVTKQLVLR